MSSKFKLPLFFLLLAAAFFFGLNYEKVNNLGSGGSTTKISSVKKISPFDLKKALDKKDFTLINVHTPYDGEIIKTDTFVPYDEIVANESKLPKDKNTKIIVYCESGNMSSQAVSTLTGLGYKNVKHLDGGMNAWKKAGFALLDLANLPEKVIPAEGFELPISWGDIGPQLISLGVIDQKKFEGVVRMDESQKKILTEGSVEKIKINSKNSQFIVDMLWALGLAQKSLVYDEGPMGKEYKTNVASFSSTGGWTLSTGSSMSHYNIHRLVELTDEEEKRVMDISKNIYRPCCGNPTSFPDCNHGMAALAAVELMVKAGVSDNEIYESVLKLNSFWFSSTYLATATYFARQGTTWENVDAKEVLGTKYSSGTGAAQIAKQVGELPFSRSSGGGCGA